MGVRVIQHMLALNGRSVRGDCYVVAIDASVGPLRGRIEPSWWCCAVITGD